MNRSKTIKHITFLLIFVSALCLALPAHAGLDLGFTIPEGTMTIDGEAGDWLGFAPVYSDPRGDSTCGTGTDLKDVYLAKDSTYLYWRIDTWSGTYAYDLPDQGPTVQFPQQRTGPPAAGDVEARIFNNTSGINGVVWQHNGTSWINAYYGPDYGWVDSIVEGKIPLSIFSAGEHRFFYQSYFSGIDGANCDSIDTGSILHMYINGSEEPVIVPSGTIINVGIESDRDISGEFWISASTPYGTYWLDRSLKWVKSGVPVSAGQYTLPFLPKTTILNSVLPAGLYQFMFILDENMNGMLDDMAYSTDGIVYITP